MRKEEQRIGEVRRMNCGLDAEIIEYNSPIDITVRFSNGAVKSGVRYCNFKKGTVSYKRSHDCVSKQRIGEVRIMNCGLSAEVIRYNNNNDITVRFSDGVVRTGINYANFKKGSVAYTEQRVGEMRVMNCGVTAEIIEYNSATNVTVRFSNGIVKSGVHYYHFKKGIVSPRSNMAKYLIGEVRLMNCGLSAELIEYNNSNDIAVRFSNGVVRTKMRYSDFKRGVIRPAAKRIKSNKRDVRVGEVRVMNCGLEAKIIEYDNCYNITVQFNNGVIKTGVTYNNFKRGTVSPRIRPVVKR